MTPPRGLIRCMICHEPQASPEGWFQVAENRWTDRLRILRFHEDPTFEPGAYSLCCPAHVRELVVHWMTTGRLDFPFASAGFPPSRGTSSLQPEVAADLAQAAVHQDVEQPSSLVGELAIHRESLTRILRENPNALSGLMEALLSALEPAERIHHPVAALSSLKPIRAKEPATI
jgi:hypothetical protein